MIATDRRPIAWQIAEQQPPPERFGYRTPPPVDWDAFGHACTQAMARGDAMPLWIDFVITEDVPPHSTPSRLSRPSHPTPTNLSLPRHTDNPRRPVRADNPTPPEPADKPRHSGPFPPFAPRSMRELRWLWDQGLISAGLPPVSRLARALVDAMNNRLEDQAMPVNDDIRIAVLQRGWVLVGRYSEDEGGEYGYLDDANVIRYWGTNRGLGQLAEQGPLSSTKLDPCPVVRFHKLTVIMLMDCEVQKWTGKLR